MPRRADRISARQGADRRQRVEEAVAADAGGNTWSANAARMTGMFSPNTPMVATSTIVQPTSEVRAM